MNKTIPITLCFLMLIIIFCGIGFMGRETTEKQKENYLNELVNSEQAEDIIDEGKGIKTVIYRGKYKEKSGIFITALSDDSIFDNESISVTDPEISLVFSNGKKVKYSTEILDNRVIFIFNTDTNIHTSGSYKIDYKYSLHTSFDSKETGIITLNRTDTKNFVPYDITLFDDVYFTLENVSITENNTEKNKSDITVNITPCNYLSSGVPTIGQAVFVDYGDGEKKLTRIGDNEYTCLIPTDFEQITIRFTASNIYASCLGTSDFIHSMVD